jgi:hypothetical protein
MTANDHDRVAIRLTSSPVFLREEGFVPIDYRLIRDAAVNGTIPAHQRNSIWHFYRDDLTWTLALWGRSSGVGHQLCQTLL